LREFRFPATFFVVSSFIRGEDWVWTDKILWLSEQPSAPEELSSQKLAATFYALNRLRPEQRNRRIEELSTLARVVIPDKPSANYRPCSWSELREMTESDLVDIGSHTVSHVRCVNMVFVMANAEICRRFEGGSARIAHQMSNFLPSVRHMHFSQKPLMARLSAKS
jgi:peptidoglycan/xylan/chitin deacetylase (PgdA/CDA1 family)